MQRNKERAASSYESHKSFYNEKLQEKEKNFKWRVPEFEYLAKTIIELKKNKVKNVKKVAGQKLGKSEQAIQKIRTGSDLKKVERRVREELAQTRVGEDEVKESEVVEKEIVDRTDRTERVETTVHSQVVEVPQHVRDVQNTPAQACYSQPCGNVHQYRTPIRTVRRHFPVVPPTPVLENIDLSEMLLQQESLQIQNTPTEKRRLPSIPVSLTAKGNEQLCNNENTHCINANTPLITSVNSNPLTKNVNNNHCCKSRKDKSSVKVES